MVPDTWSHEVRLEGIREKVVFKEVFSVSFLTKEGILINFKYQRSSCRGDMENHRPLSAEFTSTLEMRLHSAQTRRLIASFSGRGDVCQHK